MRWTKVVALTIAVAIDLSTTPLQFGVASLSTMGQPGTIGRGVPSYKGYSSTFMWRQGEGLTSPTLLGRMGDPWWRWVGKTYW